MQPTLEQKNIEMEIILKDPELSLNADASLVDQVLINLIVKAIDAVKDVILPRITLTAMELMNMRVVIRISDNGCGMNEELMNNIFIPFFDTKKNGCGI